MEFWSLFIVMKRHKKTTLFYFANCNSKTLWACKIVGSAEDQSAETINDCGTSRLFWEKESQLILCYDCSRFTLLSIWSNLQPKSSIFCMFQHTTCLSSLLHCSRSLWFRNATNNSNLTQFFQSHATLGRTDPRRMDLTGPALGV